MEELVLYKVENRIATITLNRAEKRNALNAEIILKLTQLLNKANNDTEVKVIILNAEGPAFSAGADLAYLLQLQQNTYEENLQDSENLRKLYTTIYFLPKIVIAKVEGHAIAGGCGLATVCDIIFSVPEAKFGYTEVKLGFAPAIVSCFIVRKTGESKAKELLYSGDLIEAEEAKNIGLINFVVSRENITKEVQKYAEKLCVEASGNSLKVTKELINQTTNDLLNKQLDAAVKINANVRESEDFKIGVTSFINKNNIIW